MVVSGLLIDEKIMTCNGKARSVVQENFFIKIMRDSP
jgi:hypothetical protein